MPFFKKKPDDCLHGLNPDWCGHCNGSLDDKEEQAKEDASILKNLGSWNE